MGLCLWSTWIEPPPLWVVGAAFGFYLALILAGVFVPGLGMYATVHSHGARDRRRVALTFDDGPHPQTTRAVLEMLEQHQAKATFFVVGEKVERHPDVVREIVAQGHSLGLHGFAHDRLLSLRTPAFVARDIERTQRAIEGACGRRPTLFRPPVGFISPRTAAAAKRANVQFIGWSARGFDGRGSISASRLVQRIEGQLEPGAIVLLHDAAERDDFTPAVLSALPNILEAIEARGLVAVTVEQLLNLEHTESVATSEADPFEAARSPSLVSDQETRSMR